MQRRYYNWGKFLAETFPKPANDAELAIVSKIFFGVPLSFESLSDRSYKVRELYTSYHNEGFAFSSYSLEGYDRSAAFWKWVCGPLSCGGIASTNYGSFTPITHRDKARLSRWQVSRRTEKGRTPRPMFVRLAAQCRERKNSEIRGVAVPIHGPGGWSRDGFKKEIHGRTEVIPLQ